LLVRTYNVCDLLWGFNDIWSVSSHQVWSLSNQPVQFPKPKRTS